nr:probable phosphorylase b kinase regulatory subunit beta [Penaeus vannamei]
MINSGLQIIYTMDEVTFVQNLVYYVERAYRTPDFGMWERGSKYNNGTPELHASSIGMAKAALEAINGCNLFGEKGASWSVIFVDIDAHNRNRSIFETLLPKESSSKSVDSSLLCTISFPAFATHDQMLYTTTRSQILNTLQGAYGFKRFQRDGYGTVVEDKERRYYHASETKEFENIECEWPLFYLFMILEGMFKDCQEQVEQYKAKLSPLLKKDRWGDAVVPKYYFIHKNHVNAERRDPGSQPRQPSSEGTPRNLFLWGQSVWIIASLLMDKLLHINELDLIRRYLPSYNRPRKGGRYSAFQVKFVIVRFPFFFFFLYFKWLKMNSSWKDTVTSKSNYHHLTSHVSGLLFAINPAFQFKVLYNVLIVMVAFLFFISFYSSASILLVYQIWAACLGLVSSAVSGIRS